LPPQTPREIPGGKPVKRIDTAKGRIPGTRLRGWRAVGVGALALYSLLLVVLNNNRLEVNFVFFKIRSHELLALIVILALGFAAGYIVRGRRQAAGQSKEARAVEGGSEPVRPGQHEQDTSARRGDSPQGSSS
jgi:uncharacterized integral membrane protein